MEYSDFQEQLCSLYLRLNGYFVSGFIVHAAEGELNDRGEPRSNKSEIDLLAIRFPYNAEPEREVGCSQFLMTCADRIDIVIGEVKGSEAPLKFNSGLRESRKAIQTVLQWIGVLAPRKWKPRLIRFATYFPLIPLKQTKHSENVYGMMGFA